MLDIIDTKLDNNHPCKMNTKWMAHSICIMRCITIIKLWSRFSQNSSNSAAIVISNSIRNRSKIYVIENQNVQFIGTLYRHTTYNVIMDACSIIGSKTIWLFLHVTVWRNWNEKRTACILSISNIGYNVI